MTMPNPAELLKLLSKLPKGSKAAQELVAADVAAREAAQKALYAGHTPPTETGRKAIAQAKQTLITPEQQAKLEAEMREKGKKKFLEPSKVKDRLYHGTSRQEINEFKTGKMLKEQQYPGNTIEPWAVDNRDAVFLTPNPKFAGGYSGGEYDMSLGYGPSIYPVRVQVKNPWDYDNPEHLEQVIKDIRITHFCAAPQDGVKVTAQAFQLVAGHVSAEWRFAFHVTLFANSSIFDR